jgi:hypothetical protein
MYTQPMKRVNVDEGFWGWSGKVSISHLLHSLIDLYPATPLIAIPSPHRRVTVSVAAAIIDSHCRPHDQDRATE